MNLQTIPQKQVIKEFFDETNEKNGEISLELGADGVYLRFDCDCLDALPYCQAQCCALTGTIVRPFEFENEYPLEQDYDGSYVLKRDSDGFCTCLNKDSRQCNIYENRPQTCQEFHCTRGARQRGWKLANRVHRQSVS